MKVAIFMAVMMSLFVGPWNDKDILSEPESEYIFPATIQGGIFFDSNKNMQLDENDSRIFGNVRIGISSDSPQYKYKEVNTGDGSYCFIVPQSTIFTMKLIDSTEDLNKITDPKKEAENSNSFQLKLTRLQSANDSTGTTIEEIRQPDGSFAWCTTEKSSDIDILIIGFE